MEALLQQQPAKPVAVVASAAPGAARTGVVTSEGRAVPKDLSPPELPARSAAKPK